MGVVRFEDLRVWQAAMRQSTNLANLRNKAGFRTDGDLSNQLLSASLSVASNISEGFLRRRDREFVHFLRIAAASNGEVRSCLHAARGRGYLTEAKADVLIEDSNAIGRMLRRLEETLVRPRPKDQGRTRN